MILAALVLAACQRGEAADVSTVDSSPAPAPAVTESAPAVEELPGPVAATRRAILDAAAQQDYELLAPLVEARRFLSESGFGVDPMPGWRAEGTEPLETMATLLGMSHAVSETNEGTLYQWPRFTANSNPGEMSEAERESLRTVLDGADVRTVFLDETGYFGPRLGILADGTWWFFIREGGP